MSTPDDFRRSEIHRPEWFTISELAEKRDHIRLLLLSLQTEYQREASNADASCADGNRSIEIIENEKVVDGIDAAPISTSREENDGNGQSRDDIDDGDGGDDDGDGDDNGGGDGDGDGDGDASSTDDARLVVEGSVKGKKSRTPDGSRCSSDGDGDDPIGGEEEVHAMAVDGAGTGAGAADVIEHDENQFVGNSEHDSEDIAATGDKRDMGDQLDAVMAPVSAVGKLGDDGDEKL